MPIKKEEAEIWLEHPVTRDYLARLSSAIKYEQSKNTHLSCLADIQGMSPTAEQIASRLYHSQGYIEAMHHALDVDALVGGLLDDIQFLEDLEREYENFASAQNLIETAVTNEGEEENEG